jgi:DHA1 family bicyclomycin/chloramphenicol resistance-like MFS transporter
MNTSKKQSRFYLILILGLMSAMVSVFHNNTILPMTGVMALCSISASLIYTLNKTKVLQKPSIELVEEEELEMINTL